MMSLISIPLYVLLLLVTVQGLVLHNSEDIPEIHLHRLHTFDPPGFSITWDPIKISDVKNTWRNRFTGIKVLVWKTPCTESTVYEGSGENSMNYRPQTYNMTTVPNTLPEYVVIVKPDEVTATVPHIDRETWYHIRAVAFTESAEGKYSNPMDFKLNSNDEADKKMPCERIINERSVFLQF